MAQMKGTEANLSSDKLLQIIEYMSARRLPMRLKDIADDLHISQPTVVRYLRTMCNQVVGDIATNFFTETGDLVNLYDNSLCADAENLKNAKQTVAIACGDEKAKAIAGALRTKLPDMLITDEYTAKKILELCI